MNRHLLRRDWSRRVVTILAVAFLAWLVSSLWHIASAHPLDEYERIKAELTAAVGDPVNPVAHAALVDWIARHPEHDPNRPVAEVSSDDPPSQPLTTGTGRGSGSGVEGWRSLVAAHFPAEQVDRALRVMACESGGDPSARNPSGASGLMQVMPMWADHYGVSRDALFDPDTNLRIARLVWNEQGWGGWVC